MTPWLVLKQKKTHRRVIGNVSMYIVITWLEVVLSGLVSDSDRALIKFVSTGQKMRYSKKTAVQQSRY